MAIQLRIVRFVCCLAQPSARLVEPQYKRPTFVECKAHTTEMQCKSRFLSQVPSWPACTYLIHRQEKRGAVKNIVSKTRCQRVQVAAAQSQRRLVLYPCRQINAKSMSLAQLLMAEWTDRPSSSGTLTTTGTGGVFKTNQCKSVVLF